MPLRAEMSPRITNMPWIMIQSVTTAVRGPAMALRPDCTALAVPVEKMEAYCVAKPEKVSTFIGRHLWALGSGGIDPPCAGSRPCAHCCNTETPDRCLLDTSVPPPSTHLDGPRGIAVSEQHRQLPAIRLPEPGFQARIFASQRLQQR